MQDRQYSPGEAAAAGHERLLAELEARWAQRESELHEQLAAAHAGHAKYLSFLSHDLRGGLNGILLMVEVLRRDLSVRPNSASELSDLELMRRGVLDTVTQMDRLIYAQRFRDKVVRVRQDRLNLGTMADQVRVQYGQLAEERGRRLEVTGPEPQSDEAIVRGDRVLMGLLVNGVVGHSLGRVSGGAGGCVRVGVARNEAGAWRLEVKSDDSSWRPALNVEEAELGPSWMEEMQVSVERVGIKLARLSASLIGAEWIAEAGRVVVEKRD